MTDSKMLPSISSLLISDSDLDSELEEGDHLIDENLEDYEQEEEVDFPKDIDMVDVSGQLTFDAEANPNLETRENTIYNSMSYVFNDHNDQVDSKEKKRSHTKRVILNTCTQNVDVEKYQLTFIQESADFQWHNSTRTIMVAYNGDTLSQEALTWAFTNFIDDNDVLVVYKVIPLQYIIKNGIKEHYVTHEEIFKKIKTLNLNKRKLRLIFEIRIGSAKHFLDKGIKDYDANILVMGNKGTKKSKFSTILTEDQSMEKHFIEDGKVPCIVINTAYEVPPREISSKEINKDTFVNMIKEYPSMYNPKTIHKASQMERSVSGNQEPEGRTSRFLRVGRSVARSVSRNSGALPSASASASDGASSGHPLTPSTSWRDISPVRSGSSHRSPTRGLSPFGGLFKSRSKAK